MRSILICFCLLIGLPAWARIDHAALTAEEYTKVEMALDRIASFEEVPANHIWFNPTRYRFGVGTVFAGLALDTTARFSNFVLKRFHSARYARALEILRIGNRAAITVGLVSGTLGTFAVIGEVIVSWIDGYRGLPAFYEPSEAARLMGSPQGYQRVIAMAKDPAGRESLRRLAARSERFYDFLLIGFGAPDTEH